MNGLRIKLGPLELELSEETADKATFIVFVGMLLAFALVFLLVI